MISATLRKSNAATHWSARRLAKEVGLSPATVRLVGMGVRTNCCS